MRFDKIYCSQSSQTSGRKHTQTVASKPKAVLLSLPMFRLEMDRPADCSSRSRRSLIWRNKQGSLSRVPEEPAMDNSAAYTESTAGPAVFTCPSVIRTSPDRSVSPGTLSGSSGQSADWFVSSRTLAKTAGPAVQ